jgi:formylglycine-generating enzyme required for sulfatase activity
MGTTKATTIRYTGQMAVDPTGPAGAFIRVTRGGAWHHEGVRCRPASRLKTLAGNKTSFIGFRLALTQ